MPRVFMRVLGRQLPGRVHTITRVGVFTGKLAVSSFTATSPWVLSIASSSSMAAAFAWANLVAGQDLPEALTVLSRLHEKAPANPVWVYSLALAELKLGRSAKASELIQAANVVPKSRLPRMQLVHALVLAANEQREASRKAAREVNLSRLRPAEQALLKDLL